MIRGSKDTFHGKSPVHLVNAWAGHNQLVLAQCKSEGKSNEITTIPLLLEILDIEGSIVTIDAMGTQTKIVEGIIEKKGDYILALKGNQKELREETKSIFRVQQPESTDEATEKGHGRIETRKCEVISDLEFLHGKEKWKGLASIVKIETKFDMNQWGYIKDKLQNKYPELANEDLIWGHVSREDLIKITR